MLMAKRLSLCLLLLLSAGAAIAEQEILWQSPDGSQFELLAREGDALRFKVDLGTLLAEQLMSSDGAFTRLTIPGYHYSHIEGSPELPMMNRLIEVPYGATANIEILSTTSREIDMAAAYDLEGLGTGEVARTGQFGDRLLAGVDEIGVLVALEGKGSDPQHSVFRLEYEFDSRRNVIGHQRRHADSQVHVEPVLQLLGRSVNDSISG